MAKHKSATEVTVVTEERSAIQAWVDKHWGKALVGAIAIAGVILYRHSSSVSQEKATQNLWNPLLNAIGDYDATKAAIGEIEDPIIKGWGWAQAAIAAESEENGEATIEALQELTSVEGHVLNSTLFPVPGAEGKTLARLALESVQAQEEWEKAHPGSMTNPDPGPDSTVVSMDTGEGSIEITLYDDLAPKHVENFLKLVDEKYYDGIRFHRTVNRPSMAIIQGGDPNSRDDDSSQWGAGGPDYSIPAEKNGLMHVEGVLSAAMPPSSQESSGSQFFITLGRVHHLDGRHTVFGKVTGGMDVARRILEAPVREATETNQRTDIPVTPVVINSVTRK